MKLFKYNQFLDIQPINENLDKAKKFMKDQFLIKSIHASNTPNQHEGMTSGQHLIGNTYS